MILLKRRQRREDREEKTEKRRQRREDREEKTEKRNVENQIRNWFINSSPNIYSITNPPNFIEDISSLSPPPQHIMASFDITSLYLSLPHSLITDSLHSFLSTAGTDNQTIDIILQLTKLCLSMGTFTFQKQYYSQIRGTPLGSPLSSIISEIVLSFLDRWINLTLPSDIYYWRRYVDDIFCIIKSDSLHLIQSTLHSFNSHIKFTYEAEQNFVLPFLDILIIRTPNKFHFTVYYKKTIPPQYTHFSSNSPIAYKLIQSGHYQR
ncbi:hypothetical protein LAZ67_3005470 [Cordylochernes scorpioides]|uniref:Reverse transcriptase domain-containing protein n=1 Tax=Cordylochernes scorpioides TaxID=51811 RepID=A0ABY6KC60_9ARAC|nr:hypothetical protein LAZ67_3005470 [Cordylochernes scorpioides]